jgi:hypothetical protein
MKRTLYAVLITALVLSIVLVGTAISPAVGQEEDPSLAELAELIRAGEIDVGDDYGMGRRQRFHRIHDRVLGMDCSQCHVESAPYEIGEPYNDEEGPVDRRVCLGCHLTGPATKLYEPQE